MVFLLITLNPVEHTGDHGGGLNDALRNKVVRTGITDSPYGFGSVGGLTNIITRASSYSRGLKASYAITNRTYTNRVMAIASTGLMKNGWAVVVSGSRRWAKEGYVEGTSYNAYSYFLAVEKKINKKHSIGFIGYGSPNKRGKAGVSVQEAYKLADNNTYNPYWGYQNGEKRNARVGNYHQPMLMLSHYFEINKEAKLTTSVYYNFGRGGSTALNWVDANDPRPDYYRHLPSYYEYINEPEMYKYYKNMWETDEAFRQINWDAMYFANSKYLYTVHDANGIKGNTIQGLRSKYIIEDRRNDISNLGFVSDFNIKLTEISTLSAGIDISLYKGHHFNEVADLLGGDYYLDIDKYADLEPFEITDASQSDLNNPNHLAKVGDKISHDYTANINTYKGFVEESYELKRIDLYWGVELSHTTFWRTGHMKNGRFPTSSFGDSEKQQFTNYGVKLGATYKINGKNFISVNGLSMTRAPYFWNSYVSIRTRDYVVDPLRNEQIYSGDINFIHRSAKLKARLTGYYTQFRDQTWSRSFYHDDLYTFINYSMTGVDKLNAGIELGIEANITPTISLLGVFGKGQFIYNSRPEVSMTADDYSWTIDREEAYIKNYYVGGMPQTVASAGIKYSSPKYWFVELKANYFDDIYLDINPDRRTTSAAKRLTAEDIRFEDLIDQQKLPDAFTLDVFGGKSWKVKDYIIGITVSVNNLLDKKDISTGGFEQLRYDSRDIDRFPPKYFYLYGRTYYLNVYFRML